MVYNLEKLRNAYNRGERYKFLFFWGILRQKTGVSVSVASASGGSVIFRLKVWRIAVQNSL